MKITCFSFNSPPLNDPEAFCTARFLTALVNAGVEVTLLTVPHPEQIDTSVCDELLDPAVKVFRLPLGDAERLTLRDFLRYQYVSEHAAHLPSLVKEVRRHLSSHQGSVLVTRGFPPISNVIGYHTRDLARMWVAHFSDPFPGPWMYSGRKRHLKLLDGWWAKRILKAANLVTVTNRNAIHWFQESHNVSARTKFHVAYHVGRPPLAHTYLVPGFDHQLTNFVHVGFWPRRRFMVDVFREFDAAHAADPRIALHQFGPVDPGVAEQVRRGSFPWLSLDAGVMSPRDSTALLQSSTINVVIDQNDNLPFCPFLASKFSYAVASGQPLLAVGQLDSEMGKLHEEHGSFYFAEITRPNSLRDTVLSMASAGFENLVVPSTSLQKIFSPQAVADKFLAAISALM